MDQQLIDRIYECAFEPECWPGVLDELARIADARGGYLLTVNAGLQNWIASESMRIPMEQTVKGDWLRRGQRLRRICSARRCGFLTEYDIYTDAELADDPLYRDFLWPAGFGWAVGNAISLPTGDTLIFALERMKKRGPVEPSVVQQLDPLHPHIARSALMSARLQLERARAASETLELVGLPALVFSERGKILAVNHLMEALTDPCSARRAWHCCDGRTCHPYSQNRTRRFRALRRHVGDDPGGSAAGSSGRVGAVAVRPLPGRSSCGAPSGCWTNRGRNRVHRRRLEQHGPYSSAGSFGKDGLPPSD
jgi:hypothetical protein